MAQEGALAVSSLPAVPGLTSVSLAGPSPDAHKLAAFGVQNSAYHQAPQNASGDWKTHPERQGHEAPGSQDPSGPPHTCPLEHGRTDSLEPVWGLLV